MAEFKTYTCDACGVQGALRFELRNIDYQIDLADGKRDYTHGQVDLCHVHSIERLGNALNKMLDDNNVSTVDRRPIWRRLGKSITERGV